MPAIAMPLSLLGLVPFVFLCAGRGRAHPRHRGAHAGSVDRLCGTDPGFAGGVHWGLALLPAAVRPSVRFGAGVLPLIVAWVGLVLAQMVSPSVALAVLILGYLATVLTEHRAAQRLLVPSGYVWIRWGFSLVAVVMMVMVLVLRGIGQTIVF